MYLDTIREIRILLIYGSNFSHDWHAFTCMYIHIHEVAYMNLYLGWQTTSQVPSLPHGLFLYIARELRMTLTFLNS